MVKKEKLVSVDAEKLADILLSLYTLPVTFEKGVER